MKKLFMTVSASALLGFGTFASTVSAETSSDLATKQSDIKSERSEVQSNLTDAEKQITTVLYDLKDLDKKIANTSDALKANDKKLSSVKDGITKNEKEIKALEKNIAKLEKRIEERFELLKERLVTYQKSGGDIQYLDVLAGAQDFDDFVTRAKAVKTISDSDIKLMEALERDQKEVEKEKASVDKKLAEKKEQKTELEGVKLTIKEQKKQQEADKKSLASKKDELENLKNTLEIKDSKLASLEADVEQSIKDEEAARQAEQATPVARSNDSDETAQSSNTSSNKSTAKKSTAAKSTSRASNGSTANSSAAKSNGSKSKNTKSNNSNAKKPKPSTSSAPAQKGGLSAAINAGNKYIGNSSYVMGAQDPANGVFDCSGFVQYAFQQAGISLPRATGGQSTVGTKISYSQAKPGDLVFFDTYKTNGHVGIYLGGGQFIGSQSSRGVEIVSMSNSYWKSHFSGHVRRVN